MTNRAANTTPLEAMLEIVQRHTPSDGDHVTAVPNLILSRRSAVSEPVYTSQQPTVAFILQGRKSLRIARHIYDYDVGDYLLFSQDLPVVSQVTRASAETPQLGFGLVMRMNLVRDVSARTPSSKRSIPRADLQGIGQTLATPDILDPALRLLRLLDSPEEIPVLAELYEREIMFRVLRGPLGSRLLQRVREDSVADRISKAIAWLRSNFTKPLLIPKLARQIGMSESAFYEGFKAVTALTPVQYRKRLQLQAARELMVVAGMNAGTAGYEVGYQSPAQFSRDYRRFFGRTPVEDLRAGPGLQ